MNIQRADIEIEKLKHFTIPQQDIDETNYNEIANAIIENIEKSERPIFLLGNGIEKSGDGYKNINKLINSLKIPVLYSMLAKSLISYNNKYNF